MGRGREWSKICELFVFHNLRTLPNVDIGVCICLGKRYRYVKKSGFGKKLYMRLSGLENRSNVHLSVVCFLVPTKATVENQNWSTHGRLSVFLKLVPGLFPIAHPSKVITLSPFFDVPKCHEEQKHRRNRRTSTNKTHRQNRKRT